MIRPVFSSLYFQSLAFNLSYSFSNLKNAYSPSIRTDPLLKAASLVAFGPCIFVCKTSCNYSLGDVPIGGCTDCWVSYKASIIVCSTSPLIKGGKNPAALDMAFRLFL